MYEALRKCWQPSQFDIIQQVIQILSGRPKNPMLLHQSNSRFRKAIVPASCILKF